jgi:hypothetical protein
LSLVAKESMKSNDGWKNGLCGLETSPRHDKGYSLSGGVRAPAQGALNSFEVGPPLKKNYQKQTWLEVSMFDRGAGFLARQSSLRHGKYPATPEQSNAALERGLLEPSRAFRQAVVGKSQRRGKKPSGIKAHQTTELTCVNWWRCLIGCVGVCVPGTQLRGNIELQAIIKQSRADV